MHRLLFSDRAQSPMRRSAILSSAIVFLIALTVRVAAVRWWISPAAAIPTKDAAHYDLMARYLLAHGELVWPDLVDGVPRYTGPTVKRAPLYPAFLAGVYWLTDYSRIAVQIAQCVLGAFSCVAFAQAAALLAGQPVLRVVIGGLFALYPPFLVGEDYYGSPALLQPESLLFAFLGASMWAFAAFERTRHRIAVVMAGVSSALATLTKPVVMLAPLILVVWWWTRRDRSWKERAMTIGLLCTVYALTIAPWTWRNIRLTGHVIPVSLQFGYTFWSGNYDGTRGGMIGNVSHIPGYRSEEFQGLSEVEVDRRMARKAWAYLRAHPDHVVPLAIKKLAVQWSPLESSGRYQFWYAFILMLAVVGVWWCREPDHTSLRAVCLGWLGYSCWLAVLIAGDPRYRFQYEPFLLTLAGLAVASLARTSSWRRLVSVLGVCVALNVLCNYAAQPLLTIGQRVSQQLAANAN